MAHHSSDKSFKKTLSWLLLSGQAVVFAVIIMGVILETPGPRIPASLPAGLAIGAFGVSGLLASGRYLGRSLSPSPIPNSAGLVAHGPYRWVRHPIYTFVVLTFLGVALLGQALLPYLAIGVLIILFEVKVHFEEGWLAATYEGYVAYASRTGKFVPWLGKRKPTPRVPSLPSSQRRTLGS